MEEGCPKIVVAFRREVEVEFFVAWDFKNEGRSHGDWVAAAHRRERLPTHGTQPAATIHGTQPAATAGIHT
jgi:hypothetical protein